MSGRIFPRLDDLAPKVLVLRTLKWPVPIEFELFQCTVTGEMEPLHCARGIERPIDAESAIALTREGLESGMTHVIIDLENVREVWTALLGCYIVIAKEADIAGGRVILAGPTPRIRALIEAVNLDRIFGLADTVSDALTAVEDQ